jgi:uncharacterized tellurite resistance protein B-like protein
MEKKLTDSPSYKATLQIAKLSERQTGDLSSVLVLLLKTAWIDKELKNIEAAYLMREVGHWCKLEKLQRKQLIDFHSTLVRRNIHFAAFIPVHLEHLSKSFSIDDKKRLIETMAIISRSDLSVEKHEQHWIHKVSGELKVPSKDVNEIIINAKFVAADRLIRSQSEIAEAETKADEAYVVPTIVLNLD